LPHPQCPSQAPVSKNQEFLGPKSWLNSTSPDGISKAFIDRLLAGGEEVAEKTAADYQREAAEKDREYDSTAEKDAAVIYTIAAAQREELEKENEVPKADSTKQTAKSTRQAARALAAC